MLVVTVVTVCFNSADTIEKTIVSVLSQTYEQIEYLIIDGASTDNTMDIVSKYADDERVKFISEQDEGLYDAMNKAADIAKGDYIIYMNSGDVFADSKVITDISKWLDGVNELVYGNAIRIKPYGRITEKYGSEHTPFFLLLQGKMMCHQSIFTKSDLMREYRFDVSYSITADYDFLMRMVHDKRRLHYTDVTVSIVDNIDGISSMIKNMDKMREQDDRSLRSNFPIWYYLMVIPKGMIRCVRRMREKQHE
ncbi:MAG: glycosyltransferase [Lachnospiraceae bacterium]|nr:glycosyltransferase [Lachnospiraceae bacterium]